MSIRFNLALAFILAVCFIANSASAQILLFDDFDASTNPTGLATVNGGTSDIGGAIWNADTTIGVDGTINTPSGNINNDGAFLPFTFVAGDSYLLEASITNDNSPWVALGFVENPTPTVNDRRFTNGTTNGARGIATILTRNSGNQQETFGGVTTGNAGGEFGGEFGEDLYDETQPLDLSILLDSSAGTATYTINGDTANQVVLSGIPTANIAGIGLTYEDNNTSGTASVGFIRLTNVSVPEPSSLALLGLGAIGLVTRRRKRA